MRGQIFFGGNICRTELAIRLKKQVILNCYDFRKASVRLDTFVDSAPMMPAALESKSWFSTGAGAKIS
jgi:hypothetical protein